LLRVL